MLSKENHRFEFEFRNVCKCKRQPTHSTARPMIIDEDGLHHTVCTCAGMRARNDMNQIQLVAQSHPTIRLLKSHYRHLWDDELHHPAIIHVVPRICFALHGCLWVPVQKVMHFCISVFRCKCLCCFVPFPQIQFPRKQFVRICRFGPPAHACTHLYSMFRVS